MTDTTAQSSYVDTYSPPSATPQAVGNDALMNSAQPSPAVAHPQAMQAMSSDTANASAQAPVTPPTEPANDDAVVSTSSNSGGHSPVSQALEDQNIFFLLGVTEASEDEKEEFLDELQQVIWEDFLENDVELLITEEEMGEMKQIMANKELSDLDQQEAIVTFLEKLVPDLEEIMLEKALELKADMVKERISGMKDYYADQPATLDKLTQAESLIEDDQWREAADVLNSIV